MKPNTSIRTVDSSQVKLITLVVSATTFTMNVKDDCSVGFQFERIISAWFTLILVVSK